MVVWWCVCVCASGRGGECGGGSASRQLSANPRSDGCVGGVCGTATNLIVVAKRHALATLFLSAHSRTKVGERRHTRHEEISRAGARTPPWAHERPNLLCIHNGYIALARVLTGSAHNWLYSPGRHSTHAPTSTKLATNSTSCTTYTHTLMPTTHARPGRALHAHDAHKR